MSKELEEIKSIVAIHFGALGFLNPSENEQILKDRDKVLNALQRLESIDNANPSETMKCLDKMYDTHILKNVDCYHTIKKYILKAQEQEKVLEIIKEKRVDLQLIRIADNVEWYNKEYIYRHEIEYLNRYEVLTYQISQQEFDLLKRWLG